MKEHKILITVNKSDDRVRFNISLEHSELSVLELVGVFEQIKHMIIDKEDGIKNETT